MSTAPDPKFPKLPGLIFGCSPSHHRRGPIKMLLGRYNVKLRNNDKKEDYLHKLVELENSVGEREKEALMKWLAGDNTCKALAALLGDALKPPITPKKTGEPAAKEAKLVEAEDDLIFAAVDECKICMEKLAPEKFPQSRITSTCAHHPAVCNQCLTQHIDFQVQTKASDRIQCPECPEKVSDTEIKTYASPEVLNSPTCESGQIHTGQEQPMMTCTACGFKTCFIHKLPWHEDLTCAEFDILNQARVQQEAASEAWISEHTKLCPNPECGMRIQKKSGCDHLTCDYCLYEFCWPCCADFRVIKKRGNDYHKEDCKWHTKNENGLPGHGGARRPPASGQHREPKVLTEPKESQKSKKSKPSKDSKLPEAAKGPKESNAPEELVESKEPNVLEDVKQSLESKFSEGLKQSHDPHMPEDLEQPHGPVNPDGQKQLHKPIESVEPVEQMVPVGATGLNQPSAPEEVKQTHGFQDSFKPVEQSKSAEAMRSTQPNPRKRPWEE
ncbi:hypothetical protein SBOR_8001 [Sclerotinia borealis F-4128]|uniref:RBR-type E3 ubiquitin transferase n=1 Tax=Sclerotinia borealis (strain F-4128) TaxID=1432307 RepID=W9C4B5_SCLBF|nr:hypothetical protein SBOR_8001 [Sclerotinia borealis F-4128]